MSKQHIVANINSVDISNSILCVFEYLNDNPLPSQVFLIAQYDELEDSLITDFSHFPKLNIDPSISDSLEQYEYIALSLENEYLNGHKINKVNIPVYQVISYINELGNKICSEDFENQHLISYVKNNFHIEFVKEQELRINSNKNMFSQLFLDQYIKERKQKFGF